MGEDTRIRPVRRALLSTWDKRGVVEFARALLDNGAELLATGGTARALSEAGMPVTEVGELTGAGELLAGRVKTLHPKVHAGLLARADQADELAAAGVERIDLVAVNLYPFAAARSGGARGAELLEMIDIGGPTMLRAAAKNHPEVMAVCDPDDYEAVLEEVCTHGGTTGATRARLAAKVFATTASYDAAVAEAVAGDETDVVGAEPEEGAVAAAFAACGVGGAGLRYGENPHQTARVYRPAAALPGAGTASLVHVSGKPLSYTNYLDLDAALRIAADLEHPGAAVLKHANPCGAAVGDTLVEAFVAAHSGDPLSAYGGIVGLTGRVDLALADELIGEGRWFEIIVAPSFAPEAVERIRTGVKWGKSVRLLAESDDAVAFTARPEPTADLPEVRSLYGGGLLLQSRDPGARVPADAASATTHGLDAARRADCELAWRLVGHVKSNAIVLVRDGRLVGLGAGQPSRVDSVELAVRKAGERAQGAVMASDAFFPFADGVEAAIAAGVVAVVQPGGSRRDKEVIAAAEAAGIPMLMTGRRHFRH